MKVAETNKKGEKEVKCGVCNKVLSCAASLSRHNKTKHSQSQSQSKKCTICDKDIKFKRKDNYQRHVLSCQKTNTN